MNYAGIMVDAFLELAIWQFGFWGNSVVEYIVAVCIFVALTLVFKWTQWLVLRSLEGMTERTRNEIDDAVVTVVETVKPPFYTYVAFYIALQFLEIEGLSEKIVNVILVAWLVYQAVLALQIFIEFYVKRRMSRTEDKRTQSVMHIIHSLSSVVLWTLGALFVLSNFGVDVSSLFVGLGISGIAVALAAQNILGDVFSSLAIYFDKPFVPGDFIEVGKQKGKVLQIGIKTTRIKSLSGEEIIIPNKELTSTAVNNFGRMQKRRVLFEVGVAYETPTEKLKKIPSLIKGIIEGQEQVKFDRVHFSELADSSLKFEVVYHVKTKEYEAYMDTQHAVLLGIKEAFEKEGIEMAYPTRTVYMKQGS